jgi:transposase
LAYGATVRAAVAVLSELTRQMELLGEQVEASFGQHPGAKIILSQPGLGPILCARVLAEFGDAPERYADAESRKNYSGMSPITRASGTRKVVLARYARNQRLSDALYLQAFSALSTSPGARAYYDSHRCPRTPTGRRPTARSNASTAPWLSSGPTSAPTAQRPPAWPPCASGSTSTTICRTHTALGGRPPASRVTNLSGQYI